MINIAVVGCTGKLGSTIARSILKREDVNLKYAIGRNGNPHVGCDLSKQIPVFMTGNFSVALHDFIETLKFAAKRISKDEVTTYRHQVSSRETFSDGAIEVAMWMVERGNGLYNMDDYCNQ